MRPEVGRGRIHFRSGAVFNLDHPAHTVHWHFFSMSVSNVVVIVLMLVVFAVAILAPFPRYRGTE